MIKETVADMLKSYQATSRTARNIMLKGANLGGLRLAGLRADGLDLEEADLRESSLTEVKWKGCILRDARLDAADLTDAVLRLCDLDGARANGATFVGARIENCRARGARFDGADLTGAVLTDTDFSRASLRGANLEGVSASGADFRGADLRGTRLGNAELVDADLRGADLTDADLTGADLRGADLRGVVGENLALPKEAEATAELPVEFKALAGTMAPIVAEILQTAGRQGVIDVETTAKLTEEVAALQRSTSPRNRPHDDTLKAVTKVLEALGDDAVPRLLTMLRQPNKDSPPPEAMDLIRRLRQELRMDESATVDEVLERLTKGS
ncbi:pentapeptide repeat-containing protein [Nitrospira sp. BLG_1]|uniref:pentapeptide repeat-containing protein n=1 Tax=Nitrospira sp. BLG_1 TaxID=3395883 RepID=UPI0039BC9ECE